MYPDTWNIPDDEARDEVPEDKLELVIEYESTQYVGLNTSV